MQPSQITANSSNADKMQAFKRMGTDHMRTKVMVVDDQDKKVWQLITNVPFVSKPAAIGQAVVNLVFPGVGTMIMACSSSENVSKTQLSIGCLQLLTSFIIIGWLWAIFWSFLCVQKAWGNAPMPASGQPQYQ